MVIQQIFKARLVPVDRLADTGRSSGGFGSTG
jgi:dUTPase